MSFLFAGRLPGNTQSHSRGQSLPAGSSWELNCEELHSAGQGDSTLYSPTGIKNKNSQLLPKVTWANRWNLIRSGKSEYGVSWAWISSLIEEINPDCDSNVIWREIPLLIQFPQLVLLIHLFYYFHNMPLNNPAFSLHCFCRSLLQIICHLMERWTLLST